VTTRSRTRSIAALVFLGFVLSGCAPDDSAMASCDQLIPREIVADVLGSQDGKLVQLQTEERSPVSPLVNKMTTDGIACGGSDDGAEILGGAVMIGQLPMDELQWMTIQADFADGGHPATDGFGIPGWVDVPKDEDDLAGGPGFAWKEGVLYYAMSPLMLGLAPVFEP